MAKRFSSRHPTYDDWLHDADDTPYTRRIMQRHAQFPNRSLSALNKSSLKRIPLSKRNYNALTGKQQDERERSLEVRRKLLKGSDPNDAAADARIDLEMVIRNLGNIITTARNGGLTVRKNDNISRGMIIYTDGHPEAIVVGDSEQASTIGQYLNAVQVYLNTGDEAALSAFVGTAIVDENGEEYELETDPEALRTIAEATEEDFPKIYTGGI